jgi:hypothetical protein
MDNTKPQIAVVRIMASVPFFCLGVWLGMGTFQQLWRLYSPFYHEARGSFGLILNFGVFEFGEPWSSCFALICATSFFWAGGSLLRKPGRFRLGAIVGTVCLLLFVIGFIAAG